jgi:hypothetical protein
MFCQKNNPGHINPGLFYIETIKIEHSLFQEWKNELSVHVTLNRLAGAD